MNFWTGIIIGVFVGANIGIVVAGVLAASKHSDYEEIFQPGHYPMDEAALDDAVPASSLWSSLGHQHSDTVQSHAQGFQRS